MQKVEGPVLSMEQLDEMMQTGQLIELVNGGKKCVIPESYDVAKECVFFFTLNRDRYFYSMSKRFSSQRFDRN